MAESGDGCDSFSSLFDITLQALVAWNPVLGANGANCQTLFWAGDYYCIGVSGSSTTTSAPTITPTGVATPSPVQSGINAQCTKYAEALSGTYCTKFASDNNITPAQLYTWNPILGPNGASCSTELFANTYYCVGAPLGTPTTTTSTTTSVKAPGPTQSGITPACNKFAEVVSGDGCFSFAQEHGITTDQLYAWNTMLGSGGSNCATALWLGNYYCVGVSS
jgi:LysM repeat protein